jgi:hypothetical protein
MSELVSCPNCRRQLQIPEKFFGQMVQCPECQQQFRAEPAASRLQAGAPTPSAAAPEKPDHDYTDRDERRRQRRYDDADDEDDDDDIRISRRRRHIAPHRAVLVLVLGVLAICLVAPPVTGILAWIFGSHDLKEMDAGRMDPEGRGLTQTGKVLGIVGTFFIALVVGGYCLFFGLVIFA